MPIELAEASDQFDEIKFESLMEEIATILVDTTARIEQNFANVACHPDMIEQIILDEWTGNLCVRASRIRRIREIHAAIPE